MIGEPTPQGHTNRVFGVGQYLRNLVTEFANVDSDIQFILWSSAARHGTPQWLDSLVRSHKNFSAVHIKLPNRLVDRAAYWSRLRFLPGIVGPIDVSWEVNYFPLKPRHAYSICTVHDLSFLRPEFQRNHAYNELAATDAALADKITTVSETSKLKILSTLDDLTSDRVQVVYGAAAPLFDISPPEHRSAAVRDAYQLPASYFMYAGEAAARKNLGNLIRAFQAVRRKRPESHLLMAGLLEHELTALMTQVGETADLTNVRVVGYVPQEDLQVLYQQSEALVYPSFDEGFGLPIVEAMKMGQIVVASDIPASHEVARDAALFVTPDRHESIAEGMIEALIMSDEERRLRIEKGFDAANRFSWSRSRDRMLELFEEGFRENRP